MTRTDRFAGVSFLLPLLCAGLGIAKPGVSFASTFKVTPVKIVLTRRVPTALLTVKNQSDKRLRFQASAFAWDQSPDGRMQVRPTQDVVFFPSVLSVAPGAERKVRLGSAVPFTAREAAYRIFFEELPELENAAHPATSQLNIRTRIGIPIFLQPDKIEQGNRLEGGTVRDGFLRFSVRNTGNVHVNLAGVRVTGVGRSGASVFERQSDGWYVLAGGDRDYEIELPERECGQIARLVLEARIDGKTLLENVALPPDACGKTPFLTGKSHAVPSGKAP